MLNNSTTRFHNPLYTIRQCTDCAYLSTCSPSFFITFFPWGNHGNAQQLLYILFDSDLIVLLCTHVAPIVLSPTKLFFIFTFLHSFCNPFNPFSDLILKNALKKYHNLYNRIYVVSKKFNRKNQLKMFSSSVFLLLLTPQGFNFEKKP